MSLRTDLRSLQQGGDPEIHERVDLRAWTALGVGGPADLLIRCRSGDGLQRALDLLATHGQRWLVLGSGSRLVPPDRGLRVPLLNLSGTLGLWELDLEGAVAGGGANLAQVCRAAARTGLPAFDTSVTAPGTIGGAVEASLRGHHPCNGLIRWVDVARPGRPAERIRFRDDGSPGSGFDLTRGVAVRARLQLSRVPPVEAPDGADEFPRPASIRQPRSAWPFVIAEPGSRAGELVADMGRRGVAAGGAQLSPEHFNRVCTSRSARSADVLELARAVAEEAVRLTGLELRSALRFVDEDGGAIVP